MTIQARLSESDQRLYNPARDTAHNFAEVMRILAARLEDRATYWPVLASVMTCFEVTDDDLGEACKAFTLFVATATDDPHEKMHQAMTRCGWDKVKEPAQLALMAVLGTIEAGIYFHGVREATLGGKGPCLTSKDLVARGSECLRLMSMPRWKRRLSRIWNRVKTAWSALRGNTGC